MDKKTVNINIEIPGQIHKRMKLEAVKKNITLKELMLDILKKKAESRK